MLERALLRGAGSQKESAMSSTDTKAIARRFLEVWNRGGTQLVDELAAPTLVVCYPLLPEPLHGPEAFKQFLTAFYAAFPDVTCTLEDELIAEGDRVVAHWRLSGTH